jgi:predicted dehydrogenase
MELKDKSIRVAFIGAGYMISEHIKAFSAIEGVVLAGISSRTQSKAMALKEQYAIEHCCDSVDDLYQKSQADLVVVGVSELAAPAVVEQCGQYDWTILAEKPVAHDLPSALALNEKLGAKATDVYVAHNRRTYSSVLGVSSLLETTSGVRVVKIIDQEDTKAALEMGFPKVVTENWMYANSIHLIDLFHVFARGEATSVDIIYDTKNGDTRFLSAKIHFDSGDIGIYEANWNAPGPWRVSISTAEKYLDMAPVEQAAYQNYGSRQWHPVTISADDSDFKPGLKVQAELAVKAALGEPVSLTSLADSLKTMTLIKQIYGLEDNV